MDKQQTQVTHEEVLTYILNNNLWYQSEGVTPIGSVMRQFEISLYRARQLVKILMKEGWIESGCLAGHHTDKGPVPPVKDYQTTAFAKTTDLYKKLEKELIDSFAEMCSGY